jgi:hypothetical protein
VPWKGGVHSLKRVVAWANRPEEPHHKEQGLLHSFKKVLPGGSLRIHLQWSLFYWLSHSSLWPVSGLFFNTWFSQLSTSSAGFLAYSSTTQSHSPEDRTLHSHHCMNLKSNLKHLINIPLILHDSLT